MVAAYSLSWATRLVSDDDDDVVVVVLVVAVTMAVVDYLVQPVVASVSSCYRD